MVHTGRVPDTKDRTLAESASTWMQVVFGGLGVSVAIVALVIAYVAWVQPHSSDGDGDRADPAGPVATGTVATGNGAPSTPAPAAAATVALRELTPTVGAGHVRTAGDDLVMRCATGGSSDRQRTVEYDLLGRYTAMEAGVRVSKARDNDTPLQIRIFADGRETATRTVTKATDTRLSIPLGGMQKMRLRLTCQFPDGEITLADPKLIHA
jgi:hypothetical protein